MGILLFAILIEEKKSLYCCFFQNRVGSDKSFHPKIEISLSLSSTFFLLSQVCYCYEREIIECWLQKLYFVTEFRIIYLGYLFDPRFCWFSWFMFSICSLNSIRFLEALYLVSCVPFIEVLSLLIFTFWMLTKISSNRIQFQLLFFASSMAIFWPFQVDWIWFVEIINFKIIQKKVNSLLKKKKKKTGWWVSLIVPIPLLCLSFGFLSISFVTFF